MTTNIALTILKQPIHADADGRYCLNDLHRAWGGIARHQPSNFIRLDATKEVIAELDSSSDVRSLEIVKGRNRTQGTYAVKELVYSYAMWISPKFHIAVIRAYDEMMSSKYGLKEPPKETSPIHVSANMLTIGFRQGSLASGISLKFDTDDKNYNRYLISIDGGNVSAMPLTNECVFSVDKFIEYLRQERGYLVIMKRDVLPKLEA